MTIQKRLTSAMVLLALVVGGVRLQAQTTTPADFILGPQVALGTSWFDTTEIERGLVHGGTCPETPPTDAAGLDAFILLHYYDLPLTMYVAYRRTGDARFLTLARRCADSWWKHPTWIEQGTIRLWPDQATPPPRHAGIGGLALRALDGRPELWDWINSYTRFHFDLWLKRRVNDPQLYYGLREGAFALHYAVWLAKVLPDNFPLQAGGMATNGAQLRATYLADVESIAVNYFARLQQPDGSWRWDDPDYQDTDGGTLKGITQPFMVGLLLQALIDAHQIVGEPAKSSIASQIVRGAWHLYIDGPYRRIEPVLADPSKRWRSFWYFYHGGTTVNSIKYATGGGSENGSQLWHVSSERQGNVSLVAGMAYAYKLSGDPALKAAVEEVWDAAFGGSDGIRALTGDTGKNYNQTYRRAASSLVWVGEAAPTPSLSPTPISQPTPTPTPTPSLTPTLTLVPGPLTADFPWPSSVEARRVLREQVRQSGWTKCFVINSRLWCERP